MATLLSLPRFLSRSHAQTCSRVTTWMPSASWADGNEPCGAGGGLTFNGTHNLRSNAERMVFDSSTSDQLAVLFFEKKLDDLLKRYPLGQGMGRPKRLVSFAERFEAMRDSEQTSTPTSDQ